MDKKLRNAAEKITMPEDMKERIIKACENIDKTNIERIDNDGYTEVVSGTERISRRNNIIRVVSAAAACAVLAAGIGTTGVLLHKNHRSQLADSDVVDVTEQLSSPFGDFTKVDFNFYLFDENYDGYSDETYAELADFFNSFNWGEEYENAEGREFQQDSPNRYGAINWEDDKGSSSVTIEKDGFVSYRRCVFSKENGERSIDIALTKYYIIDFEAFDKGIKEIIGNDGSESAAEAGISPFGDFTAFDFDLQSGVWNYNKSTSAAIYTELADFLNTFDWGEPVEDTSGRGDEIVVTDYAYSISWEENRVVSWLYIADDGFVSYSANKYSEDYLTSEEVERRSYSIDFEAFDKGLQNILAQDVYISQEEADRLLSGSFVLSELNDSNNVRIEPDRAEAKEMLNEFLRDGFIYMLKRSVPDNASEGYNLKYSVMLEFKTDDGQRHTENFTIYENGVVSSSEYMGTGNDLLPYTADNYSINIEEFESRLSGILGDDESLAKNESDSGEFDISEYMKSVDADVEKYLSQYPDVKLVVSVSDGRDNELSAADAEKAKKLENYLISEFETELSLEAGKYDGSEEKHDVYGIKYRYMSGGKEVFGKYYNILGDNTVVRSDCRYGETDDEWSGPFSYTLDSKSFYDKMAEFGL
ncbi:MAG: hypothetical protein IJK30_06000 [Ruminococcus sp.]|nr:hypothetical protein [Ruminococcus sp.]MBQ9895134.1 hypothetical protein [Ruminococcus sp.]